MDLQFPSIPVVLIFFLFLLMLVKYGKRSSARNSKLPPGPRKLPLIGNLHNMTGLPHRTLRNLAKKYGPIMHLQLGEISTVVVSSPRVAQQIMKTHDLIFADRPEILASKIMSYNCAGVAISRYGDYWRQLRKIVVLELLSARQVRLFGSLREEEVSNMIQSISLKAGLPVNISELTSSLSNDVTSRAAFGNKCKDKEVLISLLQEATSMSGGFAMEDLFPSIKMLHFIGGVASKLKRMHKRVDKFLTEVIEEHIRNRTTTECSNDGQSEEDLVDVLLCVQESGELQFPLTMENIKAVILDTFGAGTDTSAGTTQWAMSEMMKNHRVMKKVQDEVRRVFNGKKRFCEADIQKLDYLKLVIKETLRLHPSAPLLLPRESRERCEIDGFEIPAKTKVIVNAWGLGRDPEYWSDAYTFEPERFDGNSVDYKGSNFEYIPFGAGRRMCPGMSFSLTVIELALAQLLYHFDWKLLEHGKPENLDMTERFGVTLRRKNDLILIPILMLNDIPFTLP